MGGNVFKDKSWTKDNPVMLTDRIHRTEVTPTVKFLNQLTGMDHSENLLGSTGIVEFSGDIDIGISMDSLSKDSFVDILVSAGIAPDHFKKTGESVHLMSPIYNSTGITTRFVQVDFQFVPNLKFAKWSLRTAISSAYKGVYLQKMRADLARTINPEYKWNHVRGVLLRSDNSSVYGFDPDAIARGLFNNTLLGEANINSVENILETLSHHRQDKYQEVVDAYKITVANDVNGQLR